MTLTICLPFLQFSSVTQSCLTLRPHGLQPTRLHRPWDSPGKTIGVDCHFLLQRMKVKSEREVIIDSFKIL